MSNPEPDVGELVAFSVRTARSAVNSAVSVKMMTAGGKCEPLQMTKYLTKDDFDYYRVSFNVHKTFKYHFMIELGPERGNQRYFYNRAGLRETHDAAYDFTVVPGFKTPAWAQNAIMYQIFVDRFFNGDPTNDVRTGEYTYLGLVVKKREWDDPIENMDVANFYGGDLAGVAAKMEYLKELGVEAIYFGPLFVSPSNHKYDAQDYDYVDPHFGVIINDRDDGEGNGGCYKTRTTDKQNLEAGNKLLAEVIALAHSLGIKVILDGVFNHCGAFNKWMDAEGLYDKSEKRPEYFLWDKNGKYASWWDQPNHPKLNFEGSPKLYEEVMRIAQKWILPPFNADGWRLDVAADLGQTREFNHKFWKDFRARVKAVNPDALILAENYGDSEDWLDGTQWDSIMNYDAFMDPVSWFFTGVQKHSDKFSADMLNNACAFEDAMRYFMSKMPYPSLVTSMNQLCNHDHSRFLTRTNMRAGRLHTHGGKAANEGIVPAIMFSAVTMQFTWPGCPTLYYGDEVGLAGWTDPDSRRPYPWGRESRVFLDFHKEIIRIHKTYSALRGGSLKFLTKDYGILAYGRWDRTQSLICVFNNTHHYKDIAVSVLEANVPRGTYLKRILLTLDGNHITTPKEYLPDDGMLFITLPPISSAILVAEC